MKCPSCQTEMKDLFTGTFCPNDCDRPRPAIAPKMKNVFDVVGFMTLLKKVSREDQLTVTKFATEWRRVAIAHRHDHGVVIGRERLSNAELYSADWVVVMDVDAGTLQVTKNRFGANNVIYLPDYVEP